MEEPHVTIGQLIESKISRAIVEVLQNGATRASSGILEMDGFLRSALDYGRRKKESSARVLFDILSQGSGPDKLEAFLSSPEFDRATNLHDVYVSAGISQAFQAAREVRQRTGGRDQYLGLRHILFAISATKGETRSEVDSVLSKLSVSADQVAERLAFHLHEWLEENESWPEWEKIFLDLGVKAPVEQNVKPPVEQETDAYERNGPAARIATDRWASQDALGFDSYARAIAEFIRISKDSAPFTVSIQAPWGGGKTTLMRLIQEELDEDALTLAEEKTKAKTTILESGRGKLNVGEALDKVLEWIREQTQPDLPKVRVNAKQPTLLTVWFNAWKYQSTNQVWAGLSQAILRQIAARLDPGDRERFWLQLNLRRIDADKIRQKVYARVLDYWWREAYTSIIGCASGFIASIGLFFVNHILGATGIAAFTTVGAVASKRLFSNAEKKVKEEPAAVGFSEFLETPNYPAELGFVHRAEEDLRKALKCVGDKYQPIVIFIDDLDRCSPAKVAELVEAINLFLAGDLPECVFVLGMDTEMVAAALEAAHKDMIANLPSDARIPVGWRFMDKFVQLPFLIPPSDTADLNAYSRTLFPIEQEKLPENVVKSMEDETKTLEEASDIEQKVDKLRVTYKLSETAISQIRTSIKKAFARNKLDEGIKSFNDKNFDFQIAMKAGSDYFGGNPRELKRFVNSFRFHYHLWLARRSQELKSPNLEQVVRWTVFSMKWPEVVRWIRRGRPNEFTMAESGPTNSGMQPPSKSRPLTRLHLLEVISENVENIAAWQSAAEKGYNLDKSKQPWLQDGDLLRFFRDEAARNERSRLSSAAGQGLW